MTLNCTSVITGYLNKFKSDFSVIESEEECLLVTPLRRPDGESIEIGIKEISRGRIRLTDNFSTVDYLFVNGLNLDHSVKLYQEAERIASIRGVKLENSELYIEAELGTEAEALTKLLDAVEAVTYLIYRRAHRKVRTFTDEVELYLAENDVSFVSGYIIEGKNAEHIAPIFINSSKNLVVTPLSAPSVSVANHKVRELAFMSLDVKPVRPNIRLAAILDDREERAAEPWSDEGVSRILNAHIDDILTWDDRQRLLNLARVG